MKRFLRLYEAAGGEGGDGGSGGGNAGSGAGNGNAGAAGGRSMIPPAGGGGTGDDGKGGQAAGGSGGGDGKGAVGEIFWKGWMKEDGSFDHSRLKHLPDTLKDSENILKRYPNIEEMAKGLAHHARLASKKGLMPLREGATDAEKAEHAERLRSITNAPEKPEGYGIKVDDPELQAELNEFAAVFHKHAISPEAVKELLALNDQKNAQFREREQAAAAQALDKAWDENHRMLRNAFGPLVESKLKAASAAAAWMGLDLNAPELMASPKLQAQLAIAAAKVASRIEEAQFVDGGSAGQVKVSAAQELQALANDPNHKYYKALRDSSHPLYREALQYRRKLSERKAQEGIDAARSR